MNTSEKIASVVAQFIAADREEDRKRIAELERDNNAVVQCCGELRQSIDVYLAEIQRLTEKCAALVLEKEVARGELVKLRSYAVEHGRLPDETPAVKQEEQWVIRTSASRYESRDKHRLSNAPDGARIFGTKEEAQEHIDANCQGWASFHYPLVVITLAEARAIEAKR